MTIRQREHIQNFLQQKKTAVSYEKSGKLSQLAQQELLQMPDVKQRLWKTLWHAAVHQQHVDQQNQCRDDSKQICKMEDNGVCLSEERQLSEGELIDEKIADGGSDHLLILARSAEMMSESKDSFDTANWSDQHHEGLCIASPNSSEIVIHDTVADQEYLGNQVDGMCVIDRLRNEENGVHREGRTPRLSQIRRQARSKNNLLMQQNIEECSGGHVQNRRIRLTQIRHLARSKNHSQLQERIVKDLYGNSQGRIRLSQLRRQARSISNSLTQEANEDHIHGHLNCHTSQEISQRDKLFAEIFGAEDTFVGDGHQPEPEVDNMHKYDMNGSVIQSVIVNGETQDKMTSPGGRRSSRLKREAQRGALVC